MSAVVRLTSKQPAASIDGDVPLASDNLLSRVEPTQSANDALTDWLSITAALGLASRH